jgi:regulator of protease activity HflC (stomatin/prohibitin superfamily)
MVEALVGVLAVLGFIAVVLGVRAPKQVKQYEEGIVYRFGRVLPKTKQPGLVFINPISDKLVKVNKQQVARPIPAQEGITRDNISVRVDAVVYFRVIDPIKAQVNVENYQNNVLQQAQTSLRSIIGQCEMDELLSERDRVNRHLLRIIDALTEEPWGVKVDRVEIKDVSLPEGMKRSIARQAEAERERRARIIVADGEFQASKRLAAAANIMSREPAALQLRLLQTVVEVASEKNSTLVLPLPVEVLRFFDRFAGEPGKHPELPEDFGEAEVHAAEAAIEHRDVPDLVTEPGEVEADPGAGQRAIADDSAVADVPEPSIPDVQVPEVTGD